LFLEVMTIYILYLTVFLMIVYPCLWITTGALVSFLSSMFEDEEAGKMDEPDHISGTEEQTNFAQSSGKNTN
jgi:hypothetical protein